MAIGPGKYDDLAIIARVTAGAAGAILILIDGVDGDGFSVQTRDDPMFVTEAPGLLRQVADSIEDDLSRRSSN